MNILFYLVLEIFLFSNYNYWIFHLFINLQIPTSHRYISVKEDDSLEWSGTKINDNRIVKKEQSLNANLDDSYDRDISLFKNLNDDERDMPTQRNKARTSLLRTR